MRIHQPSRRLGGAGLFLALQLITGTACSAANQFTSTPHSDALTYSSVRIIWTTSEVSTTVLRWGTSGPPYEHLTFTRASPTRAHGWFLSGLKPATTYHYIACSTTPGGPEVCSDDQAFTTTDRGSTDPIAPAEVDVTMPPLTGAELFVGADCNDPVSGLLARWTQANWGDTVVIPVTTRCVGTFSFPAKTADTEVPHRWIVTRSSAMEELPPPGTRIDPVADAGKFARVAANRPNLFFLNQGGLPVGCEAGSYAWVGDDPRVFKLQQCRPEEEKAITGGTGAGVALVVTVPNHGYTGSPYVHVQGVTGNTNSNGTFQAVVTGPSTLQLNYLGFAVWKGNGPFTGGTIARNSWQAVSFTTNSAIPETCTVGDWFLKQDAGEAIDRTYRCLEPNTWVQLSLRGAFDTQEPAAINLSTNNAHHLRFIGLEVTPIRLPPEPLWIQATVDPLRRQPGSVFYSMVSQNYKNHHIIWDRCWVHGQSDRSRSWIGFVLDGSDVAVVDSYVNDLFLWSGTEPGSLASEAESSAFFIPKGPGPIRIENNFVEAGGVSLYVPSDFCCLLPSEPNDAVVRRNTFHVGDEWRYKSPTFAGKKIVMRHLLELKQGRRWLIEGNTFDGTFTTVNQAAAIALTPRADSGLFRVASIVNGAVVMNPLFGHCAEDVRAGDWVWIFNTNNDAHNTGWLVNEVSNGGCNLTLADVTGSSAGGNLQLMTSRKSMTDIDVRSNIFKNVANGLFIIGHTDGSGLPALQLETARRIQIYNNLFQSINGARANESDTSAYPNGLGGYPVYVSLGMEDLHFIHNTVVQSSPGPGFALEYDNLCVPDRTCNPHAGLIYENNIVQYGAGAGTGAISASSGLFGQAALDGLWRLGDQPGWSYKKNVIAIRGALPTQGPFGPYPAGNRAHDLNSSELPFINPAIGNFRLRGLYRSTDNCYGTRGDCTTTGKDAGVSFEELNSALGATGRVKLKAVGSRQIAIDASIYVAGYCSAQASSDAFATTLQATSFGTGRSRIFWFDNLTPSTLYQYRARCKSGVILTGQAQTRPLGVDRRFQLKLKPPAWMTSTSSIDAVISTGSMPGSLTSTIILPCSTGCTLEQPASDGVIVYYRVEYRRPGNVVLATGPVRAWAP